MYGIFLEFDFYHLEMHDCICVSIELLLVIRKMALSIGHIQFRWLNDNMIKWTNVFASI
jgi:hypothetical protein